MEEAGFFAKQYLEDLLSFFGLKADVALSFDGEAICLDVPSTHLNGFLIGARSETLRALTTLTQSAIQQQSQQYYRLNLDIANYKKQREDRLSRLAQKWIKEVKAKKADKQLEPMNPAERRIVHQLAHKEGLFSQSQGEGANRYVVLKMPPIED